MTSLNLPNPIIFGPERPQLRFRLVNGRQFLYSITNYNIYTDTTEFNINELGTFTIGALYEYVRSCFFGITPPSVATSKDLTLPDCICRDEPCAMLLQSFEELPLSDSRKDTEQLKLIRVHLRDKPKLYDCNLLSSLLGCATTPAEKRFAEMYYTWAICGTHWLPLPDEKKSYSSLNERYKDFIRLWHEQQLHLYPTCRNAKNVTDIIQTSLKAPALIPQVWLNYTYDPSQPPAKETSELRGMPKRVDFVFIKENKLHIIEIDDPSHYAIYDESKKKYEVSEERYTNNLKAERVLREQGFEIHRLSNWEILNTTESQFIDLFLDVLGMVLPDCEPSPKIASYHLEP